MTNELDNIALRVNGTDWRLRDVLKLACMEGGFSAVEDSISRAVILAFAEQHGLAIEEQEWKAKANEMRRQRGLYKRRARSTTNRRRRFSGT
ncbi:hypothetical protein [Cohnella yongneupensis]|uniref:Uncharacterized protein n=1 Tax=Cohnella yongneupensis TaxID=425006 RepID=A0ABW0R0J4_9BACL